MTTQLGRAMLSSVSRPQDREAFEGEEPLQLHHESTHDFLVYISPNVSSNEYGQINAIDLGIFLRKDESSLMKFIDDHSRIIQAITTGDFTTQVIHNKFWLNIEQIVGFVEFVIGGEISEKITLLSERFGWNGAGPNHTQDDIQMKEQKEKERQKGDGGQEVYHAKGRRRRKRHPHHSRQYYNGYSDGYKAATARANQQIRE